MDDFPAPSDIGEPSDFAAPSDFVEPSGLGETGENGDFGDVGGDAGEVEPTADPEAVGQYDDITSVQDTLVGNFNDSEMADTDEIATYINENIPPEDLANLESVDYVADSQEAQDNNYLGMWTHDPETNTNHIEIYPQPDQDEMFDSVAHEVGHNAEEVVNPEQMEQWSEIYNQGMDEYNNSGHEIDPFVTDYAQTSPSEDFAESYAMYINDPPLLQAVSPDKYDFMKDNVFNGKEFVE